MATWSRRRLLSLAAGWPLLALGAHKGRADEFPFDDAEEQPDGFSEIRLAPEEIAAEGEGFDLAGGTLQLDRGKGFAEALSTEVALPGEELAVSPALAGQLEPGAVGLELRRGGEDGWGEWAEVPCDEDSSEDGTWRGGLLFLPASERLQVRLRLDAKGGAAEVSELSLRLVEAGEARPSFEVPEPGPGGRPAVVARAAWGCPQPAGGQVTHVPVTHLIVHHTASANDCRDWAQAVRAVWATHVKGNGWNDVGYNFLIDPAGVVYEGRAGGDDVVGAHFSCANQGTMGVALLGTFTKQAPTPAALASLAALIGWKCRQRTLDPSASAFHASSALTLPVLAGHRAGQRGGKGRTGSDCLHGTECPGTEFDRTLLALREQVARRLASR